MTRKFYNRFIKPISKQSDQAEREIVLNYLLVGVLGLSTVAFFITLLGPVITGNSHHPDKLLSNFLTILFVVGLYVIARYKKQHKLVAFFLTMLIIVFGCFVIYEWGLQNAHGILLLGLAVVMAGILIGARYSLYVTCGLIVFLAYLQHGQQMGYLRPDLSWIDNKPIVGDVVLFSTILFAIALVSWLFNRQMELSLRRAQRSERALQRQKDLLEIKVKQRTQQLEAAQLEQMQELYRFAELGRLSTALFHDLANHLTTVSIDIEGLKNKHKSEIMQRMHDNVRHIDNVVQRVRQQIQGKSNVETFNVTDEINEIIKILSFSASKAGVDIILRPGDVKPSLLYKGDVTRFRQILLNITCNGIEAYGGRRRNAKQQVIINLERIGKNLVIEVSDHGSGIPQNSQAKIFEPFYSTKAKGVGIGLFIVKQVVENDFKGTISLASDKRQGTTFSVTLPKSYYAQRRGS